MTFVDLLILGVIIGANNFAVALALGALGQLSRRYRVMLVFGFFEFFIPLIGLILGASAARKIGMHSVYIGAALLFGLGLLVVIEGFRGSSHDERLAERMTRWGGLVVLGASLSVDNLVVGFSLGLAQAPPLVVAGTICFFSVLFVWLGMQIGRETRHWLEGRAKVVSGLLLMLLGVASGVGWI